MLDIQTPAGDTKLLRLGSERPWLFQSIRSNSSEAATSNLRLTSNTSSKWFYIDLDSSLDGVHSSGEGEPIFGVYTHENNDMVYVRNKLGIGDSGNAQSALMVKGTLATTPSQHGVHIGTPSNSAALRLCSYNNSGNSFIDFTNITDAASYKYRITVSQQNYTMDFVNPSNTTMRLNSNGNVFIYHDLNITENLQSRNFYDGTLSGSTGNLFIGNYSLDRQNGITASGHSNLGIGYSVLDAITSGQNNLGLGKYALTANTNGNSNVAIGSNSNGNNTTGSYSISIGHLAMGNNETGNYNMPLDIVVLMHLLLRQVTLLLDIIVL